MSDLSQLRAEIDAIDDELIALLKKRIGVVGQVGALKRKNNQKGLFIRPGREGEMHRRIAEVFADTPYPPEAVLGIWRLLIAASTQHESAMTLGILTDDHTPEITSLAREYFGTFLERRSYSHASSLLGDLRDERVHIGIVPYPYHEAGWWLSLAQYEQPPCFIFAQLPILADGKRDNAALAIGALSPEPSGEDLSYYALQIEEHTSTSKLHQAFHDAQLKAHFINVHHQPPMRWALVTLEGFYPPDAPTIAQLGQTLGVATMRFLGAHPKPLSLPNTA